MTAPAESFLRAGQADPYLYLIRGFVRRHKSKKERQVRLENAALTIYTNGGWLFSVDSIVYRSADGVALKTNAIAPWPSEHVALFEAILDQLAENPQGHQLT